MRDIPGITSPITHAGRVVYNARRDWLDTRRRKRPASGGLIEIYPNSLGDSPENHSIQPYELCFRHTGYNKYNTYSPNDTDMNVFSSANGIVFSESDLVTWAETQAPRRIDPRDKVSLKPDESSKTRVDYMKENIVFVGVACNRAIYDPSNHANEEGLAVQIGGLQTIYNTGEGDIYAGDIVIWDEPAASYKSSSDSKMKWRPKFPGIPHEKALFTVRRLSGDDFRDGAAAITVAQLIDLQKRVVGKSMSTAKKGQPFDILLGRYCV